MQTIQEFYEQNVRFKPAAFRLRLATLILNDIPPQSLTDDSETWTDEDIEDFHNASSAYMLSRMEEEENA